MLTALSALPTEQTKPTMAMMQNTKQFMDYATSNSKAILTYKISDMVLTIHSNASYLSKTNACSRVGGHFFLLTQDAFPPNNGAAHNTAQVIKDIMSSAVAAELVTLFLNAKLAAPV